LEVYLPRNFAMATLDVLKLERQEVNRFCKTAAALIVKLVSFRT